MLCLPVWIIFFLSHSGKTTDKLYRVIFLLPFANLKIKKLTVTAKVLHIKKGIHGMILKKGIKKKNSNLWKNLTETNVTNSYSLKKLKLLLIQMYGLMILRFELLIFQLLIFQPTQTNIKLVDQFLLTLFQFLLRFENDY